MRSTWAVAVNTFKQILRLKVAITFILLVSVLLPLMAVTMTGDGTVKGRCQVFISYGMSLTSLLLSVLTIIACAYSVTSEIEHKQIYSIVTKPIRRHQYLLGKLIGVLMLDIILLVIFCAAIYGICLQMPKFLKASPEEYSRINNEFFTAREGLTPSEQDVAAKVADTYRELEKKGQLPPEVIQNPLSRRNYMKALENQLKVASTAADIGQQLTWEFDNVKPLEPNQSFFIKFKYEVAVNPPDLKIHSRWLVGDFRQIYNGGKIKTPIYTFEREDLIRTSYEFSVPFDAVAEDGFLGVGFLNLPSNATVVLFEPNEGLAVLYKADSFKNNFVRASVMIFIRLFFLASLSLFGASFLTFPVVLLLNFAVFSISLISGFITMSFDYLSENLKGIYSLAVKPLMIIFPEFDSFNPTSFLIHGRFISYSLLGEAAFEIVLIKAFLLLVFALLIFRYRELAKITV